MWRGGGHERGAGLFIFSYGAWSGFIGRRHDEHGRTGGCRSQHGRSFDWQFSSFQRRQWTGPNGAFRAASQCMCVILASLLSEGSERDSPREPLFRLAAWPWKHRSPNKRTSVNCASRMSHSAAGRAQGPKMDPAFFCARGGPGGPGKASIAFLRGVAFATQSFRPFRGLATPFDPNLPFIRHLHTPQLAAGRIELC